MTGLSVGSAARAETMAMVVNTQVAPARSKMVPTANTPIGAAIMDMNITAPSTRPCTLSGAMAAR